ncbi:hypothetical protein IAT40_007375 [Kwoniella sp. CBS 6097]
MYRLAAIVLILTGIFVVPHGHLRLIGLVEEMLKHIQAFELGQEVGLLWPIIIIASEGAHHQRPACMAFIQRCQWKGSAGPAWVERIVRNVWSARDAGNSDTWRDVVVIAGSPLII